MPSPTSKPFKPAATAAMAVAIAALALSACGSSSKTTSTSAASASASTGTGASGSTGASGRAGRFAALRECLRKQGITLPTRRAGRGLLGGATGATLPPGVSSAKYQEALKKCGGSLKLGRGALRGRGAFRLRSGSFKKELAKFATCMREQGINVPAPNTSGSGPIFNTKGLNTTSPTFKAAEAKCITVLRGGAAGSP